MKPLAWRIGRAGNRGFDPEAQVRDDEVATWTTAPVDYDWFGTREIYVAGTATNGKPIRMVAGPVNRVDAQRDRYQSGLHLTASRADWEKLVEYGLVKLS